MMQLMSTLEIRSVVGKGVYAMSLTLRTSSSLGATGSIAAGGVGCFTSTGRRHFCCQFTGRSKLIYAGKIIVL